MLLSLGQLGSRYMMYLFRENLLDRNIVTLLPWQLNPQQMCFSYMCTLGESKNGDSLTYFEVDKPV